jgi:hypothetical protein
MLTLIGAYEGADGQTLFNTVSTRSRTCGCR